MVKIPFTKFPDGRQRDAGYVELLDDGNAYVTVFNEVNLKRIKYMFIIQSNNITFLDINESNDIRLCMINEKGKWSFTIDFIDKDLTMTNIQKATDLELNKQISFWVIDKLFSK